MGAYDYFISEMVEEWLQLSDTQTPGSLPWVPTHVALSCEWPSRVCVDMELGLFQADGQNSEGLLRLPLFPALLGSRRPCLQHVYGKDAAGGPAALCRAVTSPVLLAPTPPRPLLRNGLRLPGKGCAPVWSPRICAHARRLALGLLRAHLCRKIFSCVTLCSLLSPLFGKCHCSV